MPVPSDTVVKVLMQQRAELIGYAWIVVGDPDTAEDVFQEVSVAAIRKCDQINGTDHLVRWLFTAIRLEGLKARRNKQTGLDLFSPDVLEAIEQARPDDEPADSEQMSALRECINALHGNTRAILQLRYANNIKPADIAQQTGKHIQTVYKTITRAHSALRQCITQRLAGKGQGR